MAVLYDMAGAQDVIHKRKRCACRGCRPYHAYNYVYDKGTKINSVAYDDVSALFVNVALSRMAPPAAPVGSGKCIVRLVSCAWRCGLDLLV